MEDDHNCLTAVVVVGSHSFKIASRELVPLRGLVEGLLGQGVEGDDGLTDQMLQSQCVQLPH